MRPAPLPDPPDTSGLDAKLLGLAELRALHHRLGLWLEAAESAPLSEAPDENTVEAVRDALTQLTRERSERQSDERRET